MVCLQLLAVITKRQRENRDLSIPEGRTDLVAALAGLEVDLELYCCQRAVVIEVWRPLRYGERVEGSGERAVWACFDVDTAAFAGSDDGDTDNFAHTGHVKLC